MVTTSPRMLTRILGGNLVSATIFEIAAGELAQVFSGRSHIDIESLFAVGSGPLRWA